MRVSQFVMPDLGVIDVFLDKLGALYVVSMKGSDDNTVQALYEHFDYWISNDRPDYALHHFFTWAKEQGIALIDGFDLSPPFLEDHYYRLELVATEGLDFDKVLS